MKLTHRFSTVEFLLESENNCKVLSNLYEAINYVLQYHDDGNEEFLVTLIKYRDTISFVETFKFNDVKLEKEASSEALDEEPKEDM